jgi:hypothetical protein
MEMYITSKQHLPCADFDLANSMEKHHALMFIDAITVWIDKLPMRKIFLSFGMSF